MHLLVVARPTVADCTPTSPMMITDSRRPPESEPRLFIWTSVLEAKGRGTPHSVRFKMVAAPRGKAVLRLAICGAGTRSIDVTVNGQSVGQIALGPPDGVITRHQVQGLWYEREVSPRRLVAQAWR